MQVHEPVTYQKFKALHPSVILEAVMTFVKANYSGNVMYELSLLHTRFLCKCMVSENSSCTVAENLIPVGIHSPDHAARNVMLHLLRNPSPFLDTGLVSFIECAKSHDSCIIKRFCW